ncbi:hypothetical protein COV06_02480 [Candidatus Uhrbacteria bacterium CG10_big_fil_rev_8_21_14_0_10_50_16]|uniref:Methyltransferase type 11 domain-containing protein n=1 Tax=Candidatus Uhrbacteria bacterium CG10_big_fil_rev_8_21_14_0_10_50_16 TaxID=1975039 RepID=A0A2H0RMD0_9BACT|nr:MAG: hypothetical protein COV06_02480 [Candidatus Uhrbacteria bacterium CG10_big_fil_rev_8_21_14_0_10_50_16]
MDTADYWSKKHTAFGQVSEPLPLNLFVEQCLGFIDSQGRLLNLGAGQGEDSIFFAQHGFTVVTTDISQVAIDLSRERAMLAAEETIAHLVVDVRNVLPFEDEVFEIVFSNLGLHYFSEKETRGIFNEIHRVLASKGKFCFTMNNRHDPATNTMKQIEEGLYLDQERDIEKSYFSLDQIRRLLRGLFVIELLDVEGVSPFKDSAIGLTRCIARKI